MTASAARRRRRTIGAALMAACLVLVAGTMLVVGGITLANSREGDRVENDARPVVTFPATPNALLAIADDDGALASIAVVTLLPTGVGGSIVPLPVNADSTAGFGVQRRPLNALFDPDDADGLTAAVEEMLAIVIERTSIVDPDGLTELLAGFQDVEFESAEFGSVDELVAVLTEVPEPVTSEPPTSEPGTDGTESDETDETGTDDAEAGEPEAPSLHERQLAAWEALAAAAPLDAGAVPGPDADDTAVLLADLWRGPVAVHDLALAALVDTDDPTNSDAVLIDRRDSGLVFAQISPSLVASVSAGTRLRVIAAFTDEQLAAAGVDGTNSDVLRDFISRMLFAGATVVSVDAAQTGAPAGISDVAVIDPTLLEQTERVSEVLFGSSQVALATTVIEGVDMEIRLGTDYLTDIQVPFQSGSPTDESEDE